MTKDELKAALAKLTNESTEPEVVAQVDAILEGYTADEVVKGLEAQLEVEKERFKKRFWGGEEKKEQGDHEGFNPARDYGDSDELFNKFFGGV